MNKSDFVSQLGIQLRIRLKSLSFFSSIVLMYFAQVLRAATEIFASPNTMDVNGISIMVLVHKGTDMSKPYYQNYLHENDDKADINLVIRTLCFF